MINTRISKSFAMIALLCVFCIGTAFSSDAPVALRGSGRELANEKISVYRCDSENRTITSTISNKTEELEDFGCNVRICFEATSRATSNNLYILKIDDFVFTKDRTNGDLAAVGPTRQIPVMMRQTAVDHGVAMSTDFTEIYCSPGSQICAIETRLTGYFFLTSGTIRGKGSVMIQRGRDERRELQQMDQFEDVYIELDFTGGGRPPMPRNKQTLFIGIGVLVGVLFLLCCSGLICCLLGICCFAAADKKEDEQSDEDSFEEVSVNILMEKSTKISNKRSEDDSSETESLEDDKYWDDDIHFSGDENESDNNSKDSKTIQRDGASEYASYSTEESPRTSSSKRRSSLYDFGEEDWDVVIPVSEGGSRSAEKSLEDRDTNEITRNQENVEESPKKRRSERRTSEKFEKRKSERRRSEKSERRKSEKSERRMPDIYERSKSERTERSKYETSGRSKYETSGRRKSDTYVRTKSEKGGRRKSDTYERRKSEKAGRRKSDTYERRKSEKSERRKSSTYEDSSEKSESRKSSTVV